jgi:hypothetical protein
MTGVDNFIFRGYINKAGSSFTKVHNMYNAARPKFLLLKCDGQSDDLLCTPTSSPVRIGTGNSKRRQIDRVYVSPKIQIPDDSSRSTLVKAVTRTGSMTTGNG